jgi:hypothetical protein
MTIVEDERPAVAAGAGPKLPPERPRRSPTPWLLAGVLVIALVAVAGALRGLVPELRNPFTTDTVDRTQPAVLKALEDLREYRAATGNFQVVVDLEKDARYLPSFVKGERTLFVAAGNVDAGVDFSALGGEAVTVSPDRRAVTVTLPHAKLSRPRVDPARSYVYERDRGVLDRVGSVFSDNPTSDRPLYLLAEQRLAAAARGDAGIVERAEQNTRAMLEQLLRALGFTEVEIVFGPTIAG